MENLPIFSAQGFHLTKPLKLSKATLGLHIKATFEGRRPERTDVGRNKRFVQKQLPEIIAAFCPAVSHVHEPNQHKRGVRYPQRRVHSQLEGVQRISDIDDPEDHMKDTDTKPMKPL